VLWQGGILLGPSALGRISDAWYMRSIFPKQSEAVLETVADVGLMYFLFMVGLELDLRAVIGGRMGRQAALVAAAGIALPFAAGVGVSTLLLQFHHPGAINASNMMQSGSGMQSGSDNFAALVVFMGVALSITAFPVLARILAERRLLTTDVGHLSMAAAAVNDVAAWILLALAVALSSSSSSSSSSDDSTVSGTTRSPLVAVWVLLSGLAFVTVMLVAVKPALALLLASL
jgi:Kef-type K+ transport system membrane component KefB